MDSRIVDIGSLSPAEEQGWRDLAGRAVQPNPSFEPDFLLPSSRHFHGYARTRLVLAQEGDEVRGVVPIVTVERRKIPPRPVASTRGYPTAFALLCTPLVDASSVDASVGAMLDALAADARRRGHAGIFSFDRLGNGPVFDAVRRGAEARGLPSFVKTSWECGAITRANGWEIGVEGHRRRELGRRRRQLEKAAGTEVALVDRTADASAVDEFLHMEASGWKGRDAGTAFALDDHKVAWFREWRDRWAATGRLLTLSLQAGEETVAMQWYVWAGATVMCFRIAYDDRYAKFSPGSILFADVLEFLRDRTDAEELTVFTDRDNRFFLDVLPERRHVSMLLVGTGGPVDRVCVSALPTMGRMAARQRAVHTRLARSA